MFGGGWTEMLIIGIVALVVIGPKDLPIVMRKVGRVVGTVRRMGSEFQRELNKTTGLDQITDLRRSITEPLRQTSEEIAREFNRQTATGVEPTGVIKPTDPKVESVYDQIAATAGVSTTTSAEATAPTAPEGTEAAATAPLPAPPEAEPASKPRRARAKAASAAAKPDATPAKAAATPRKRTRAQPLIAPTERPPAPPVETAPPETAPPVEAAPVSETAPAAERAPDAETAPRPRRRTAAAKPPVRKPAATRPRAPAEKA
jgi:sec-independent protein translocase protein TatB